MNEPTSWQIYLFIGGLIAAWSLVIIGTTKWVLGAGLRSIQKQFDGLDKKVAKVCLDQAQQILIVLNYQDCRRHRCSIRDAAIH